MQHACEIRLQLQSLSHACHAACKKHPRAGDRAATLHGAMAWICCPGGGGGGGGAKHRGRGDEALGEGGALAAGLQQATQGGHAPRRASGRPPPHRARLQESLPLPHACAPRPARLVTRPPSSTAPAPARAPAHPTPSSSPGPRPRHTPTPRSHTTPPTPPASPHPGAAAHRRRACACAIPGQLPRQLPARPAARRAAHRREA